MADGVTLLPQEKTALLVSFRLDAEGVKKKDAEVDCSNLHFDDYTLVAALSPTVTDKFGHRTPLTVDLKARYLGTCAANLDLVVLATTPSQVRQRFKALLADYHLLPADVFLPLSLPSAFPQRSTGRSSAKQLDAGEPRWILWFTGWTE